MTLGMHARIAGALIVLTLIGLYLTGSSPLGDVLAATSATPMLFWIVLREQVDSLGLAIKGQPTSCNPGSKPSKDEPANAGVVIHQTLSTMQRQIDHFLKDGLLEELTPDGIDQAVADAHHSRDWIRAHPDAIDTSLAEAYLDMLDELITSLDR